MVHEGKSGTDGLVFSNLNYELARFVSTRSRADINGADLIVLEWDSLVGDGSVRMSMKIFGGDEGSPLCCVDFLDARLLCKKETDRFLDPAMVEMSVLHMFKPKRSVAVRIHTDDHAQTAIVRITDAMPDRSLPARTKRLLVATSG